MKNLKKKMSYALYAVLVSVLFTSCDLDRPNDAVYEGKQNMIIWSKETVSDEKYGKYEYYITDASGMDWRLKSHQDFNVGDTLRISNDR